MSTVGEVDRLDAQVPQRLHYLLRARFGNDTQATLHPRQRGFDANHRVEFGVIAKQAPDFVIVKQIAV